MSTPVIDETDFIARWHRWREERDREVSGPEGILAVVGIGYLTADPAAIDRLPGRWRSLPEGVVVELADDEHLVENGERRTGRVVLARPDEGGSRRLVQDDALTVELVRASGWDIVRVRDAAAPAFAGFAGTPAYAPDPAWRVVGRWLPQERALTVATVSERVVRESVSPGSVEFVLRGRTHRLAALPVPGRPGQVAVLFRDATSGVTTYAAQRELLVELPAAGDEVVIDFTRAYNKPCAYSDFALCPLPPAGNVLEVAVEAGERIPYERGGAR